MKFAAWLVTILMTAGLVAQEYFVRNISMRDGLPFNQITCLFQDSKGFIWVGTTSGLARLDAFMDLKIFRDDDGLHTNYCVGITEDRKGRIWVQTNSGVACQDESGRSFIRVQDTTGYVPAITSVGDYIYFPSDGSGLFRCDVRDYTKTTHVTSEDGLPSNTIRHILPLSPDTLWLSTDRGLYLVRFSEERPEVLLTYLSGTGIWQVAQVKNHFAIATAEGLYTLEGDVLGQPDQPAEFLSRGLRSLQPIRGFWPDEALAVVLSGGDQTLHVGRGNTWSGMSRRDGISSAAVTCIFQDREGVLWLGTNKGLDIVASPAMVNYRSDILGFRDVFVYCVRRIQNETWIGSRSGMAVIGEDGRVKKPHPRLDSHIDYWDFALRGSEIFAVSTDRILRLNGNNLTEYRDASGSPLGRLYDLDVLGNEIFVCGRSGIFRFNGSGFTAVPLPEPLRGISVYSCHLDASGGVWLCTLGKGAWHLTLEGEVLAFWDEEKGFPSNTVYDMTAGEGTRWFGTTRGIVGLDLTTSRLLLPPSDNLLRRAAVPSLDMTDEGLLWVGSLEGLILYDPMSSKNLRQFTDRNGILGTDVASSNGVTAGLNGEVWYASASNGISRYAPMLASSFPTRPAVLIGAVHAGTISRSLLASDAALDLSFGDARDVEITLSVLSFRDPESIELSGYLYPFEQSFKPLGRVKSVRYTNLDPGRYTFHLIAEARGDRSEPSTVTLTVLPPWWRAWWFLSLVMVCIVASGMGAYRLRIRKIRARERELESIVEARTRDLIEEKEKLDRAYSLLEEEKHTSEKLLLNVLPEPIALRLKQGQNVIADSFTRVTVLFADIVGFTTLSQSISPVLLLGILNEIFSAFDQLAERHGLEKIKTIGDAYMVVGGLPVPRKDHAHAVISMALDMQGALSSMALDKAFPMKVRIGIHSGPVVAGVIGTKKFAYDLWGDTVNTASRMESHGVPRRFRSPRRPGN